MATWVLSGDATLEDVRAMIERARSGDAIVIPSAVPLPQEKPKKRLRLLSFHPDMLMCPKGVSRMAKKKGGRGGKRGC